jgi:prephenate dehydrogenase
MKLFKKVAIVGLGLIGGSLALAIKQKKIADEIIGVSRRKKTIELARKSRIIDKGYQDIRSIAEADLVVLAAPVCTILDLAKVVSKVVNQDCIVTDVGSTKKEIVARLQKLFRNYVGAHPLAGSEKKGVVNADPDIFKNSLCILTPTSKTNPRALKKIKTLWNQLGAKTIFLSASNHDRILSFVSHLPHATVFSLVNSIPRSFLKFASSGLRDTTRIAASDSSIWENIFLSNRKNILKAIDTLQDHLLLLKSAIRKKDQRLLNKILRLANKKREALV